MKSIILNKIEVATKDLYEDKYVNHYDFNMPKDLEAEGWRLPTSRELKEIFEMEDGNFVNDWYMTSEYKMDFTNLGIHFETREEKYRDVSESHWGTCRIRLVKDL